MTWVNDTAEDGTLVFIFHPPLPGKAPYPVMVYSHGSVGEYAMYTYAIERYVSHGFVVIFPHIISPKKDTSALTLDPHGNFTIKGVHYALQANSNASSPLYKALDLEKLVLAGHSMGASSTIMAAKLLPPGVAKAAVAQHPGICGPFGPPPCLGPGPLLCSTWMPKDFTDASESMPLILTTATNDGAFWPAPATAKHEYGCYNKSVGTPAKGTAFVEFSADVCQDDGTGHRYDRKWSTGGHDCPMRADSVETQWVITAAKLYGQLGGDTTSHCYAKLWGKAAGSLSEDPAMAKFKLNPKAVAESILLTV
jgi:dienelactone hydrolase